VVAGPILATDMAWQYTPYLMPMLLAALTNIVLCLLVRRRSEVPGARVFWGMICSAALWSTCAALQLASADPAAKIFFYKLIFVGVSGAIACWPLFALLYAGHRFPRWLYALLMVEPLLVQVAVWSNDYYHLFWQDLIIRHLDGVALLEPRFAALFWGHAVYSYVLLLAGTLILLKALLVASHLYRGQIAVAAGGALVPWAANILFLTGLTPPLLDPTPLALTLAASALAWGLFRRRLSDVIPIAHEAIIAGMEEGVLVLDARSRLAFINPAAQRIFAIDPALALGRTAVEGLPDFAGQLLAVDDSGGAELDIGHGVNRRSYELQQIPLRDFRQQSAGRMLTLHDITERKSSAQTLRVLKDAAEEASRAKSEFLANMSHALRTPLNAVLGNAQIMAEDTRIAGEDRRSIDTIDQSGQHLLGLINDILDLTKIESGRQELNSVSFDLQLLVEAMDSLFALRCRQRGLLWRQHADLRRCRVCGDEGKLRQVLINLLGNAVKFTERGQVELRVTEHRNSGRYLFEVCDTGLGIDPSNQREIFEAFRQEQAGLRWGGSGLGLAIARRHVEIMGGQLELESRLGEGSRFFFELVLPRAFSAEQRGTEERWSAVQALAPGHELRALVVDDVETNRDVLARILMRIGAEVEIASGGEEGLAAVRRNIPDIVLTDLRMPGVNGSEMRRRLVEEHGDKCPPIVAVTASVFSHQRQQYLDEGFDDFLEKPLRRQLLFASIAHLLGTQYTYRDREQEPSTAVVAPIAVPAEICAALQEAVLAQSITQIQKQLERLSALGAGGADLATKMRAALRRFDMKTIKEQVENLPRA